MIDLHAHVLPGLDDGPRDERGALALLAALEAEGVTDVVATPHTLDGRYDVSSDRMREGVARLRARAAEAGLGLRIHPGAEVMAGADLPDAVKRGDAVTVADTGRYLLVETPLQILPPELDRLFFALQLEGVIPILAHPERTVPLQKHPDRLVPLVEAGTLVQLDAGSLTGHFGRDTRRAAFWMLDRGLAHLVASDAHDTRVRAPRLQAAYWVVESRRGTEEARLMTEERPGRILRGEPVESSEPAPAAIPGVRPGAASGRTKRPTWWRRLLQA